MHPVMRHSFNGSSDITDNIVQASPVLVNYAIFKNGSNNLLFKVTNETPREIDGTAILENSLAVSSQN